MMGGYAGTYVVRAAVSTIAALYVVPSSISATPVHRTGATGFDPTGDMGNKGEAGQVTGRLPDLLETYPYMV